MYKINVSLFFYILNPPPLMGGSFVTDFRPGKEFKGKRKKRERREGKKEEGKRKRKDGKRKWREGKKRGK